MTIFNEHISTQSHFTSPPQSIQLIEWLEWCKYGHKDWHKRVEKYRQTGSKELKRSLPLATVGALLTGEREPGAKPGSGYRVQSQIKNRTGWIALDIDREHNPDMPPAAEVRDYLAASSINIAFAGLSVGGEGVWCLVKVSDVENLDRHFKALVDDFKRLRPIPINLDKSKGRNPLDARFYSYDPDAIIRESFIIYEKKTPRRPHERRKPKSYRGNEVFKEAEKFARNRGCTFTPGDMHHSIALFCMFLNRHGVPRENAEDYIDRKIKPLSEITSNCISHPYESKTKQFETWGQWGSTTYTSPPPEPPEVEFG